MSTFKFVTLQMGSGWMSGHVVVDEYHSWPHIKGGNQIHLNYDTDCFDEFSGVIDGMISELEHIRKVAKKRFAADRAKTLAEVAERKALRAASP